MSHATLIFPHQLFDPHPSIEKGRPVWLVEDSLFFGDDRYPARFLQQKLLLHRAAFLAYRKRLEKNGHEVTHVEFEPGHRLSDALDRLRATKVHLADPVDFMLEKRLRRWAKRHDVELKIVASPMFLSPQDWLEDVLGNRSKKFLMADFYKKQRKRLGILVDDEGEPEGGKWSFDTENRKKLPADLEVPAEPGPVSNPEIDEARAWVTEHFASNPGQTEDFTFPVTHEEAEEWLSEFVEKRLIDFGPYEDAISRDHTRIFHGMLTPMLNIGLLTPKQIVDAVLEAAEKRDVPLNSLEGFIRQIIGWREFMMALYQRIGVKQRTSNFWNFHREIPDSFYTGETGLDPVDTVIQRILKTGYCHHIERLMILGNIMCLCRFHPDAVYRWFMEMFIDAYDWVMVPNVYGMSQFADGGLMTTKPYISSSNYVRKMSDFKKGDWCETWDGLYWAFVAEHRSFFEKNPRLSMMTKQLDRMGDTKLEAHLAAAEKFLES